VHGDGRGSLADKGRGAVAASPVLCWFPACGSGNSDAQDSLSVVVALPEDFPLLDTDSACLLPLQRRVSLRAGLVAGTAATGQPTGILHQQKSKGALTSPPACHTAICLSCLLLPEH